jgi:hypothetical protein
MRKFSPEKRVDENACAIARSAPVGAPARRKRKIAETRFTRTPTGRYPDGLFSILIMNEQPSLFDDATAPLTFPKIVTTWIIAFTHFEDHDLARGTDGAYRRMSFAYGRADPSSPSDGGCDAFGHDLCARRHIPHGLRPSPSGRGAGSSRFLHTFKDYPPGQRPSGFSIDQMQERLQQSFETVG